MDKIFNVIIEKDTDRFYVSSVPALRGSHTQAKSLDELMERTRISNAVFLLKMVYCMYE